MADNEPVLIPLRLETIRIAFMQLEDRVNAALRTQIGDRLRLREHNGGVLRMLEAIQQHSDVIPPAERQVMEDNRDKGLELCGPTGLAPVAEVSSRTICRHALEYELVEPAAPVYVQSTNEATGEVIRTYTSSTTGPVSDITDGELDQLMHHIL
ncbi:hypothetical protein DFH08DRAFT_954780 [Mycena albidolilacea]|uniref:Uncharacterized protein n=1 Tax=Mycena albidolilacea TaxID=1033008 RepID=A0AAD7ADM5_9AGAR|nr:hypothetical protein DFH08DRAFT_954780 [Mycena albidolilacea]